MMGIEVTNSVTSGIPPSILFLVLVGVFLHQQFSERWNAKIDRIEKERELREFRQFDQRMSHRKNPDPVCNSGGRIDTAKQTSTSRTRY